LTRINAVSVGVIIVAAGRSERMGTAIPKPLLKVGERTILQRSVAIFDRHQEVAELIVVLPSERVASAPELIGPTVRPCRCVAGGRERHDSVRAGFSCLSDAVDVVLVHDAARPFADAALVDRVLAATRATGAAVPAVQARDTVKRVDRAKRVVETLPRRDIWMAQTPQGFRRSVLGAAMQAASSSDVTDEAMIVERAGHAVEIVEGDERNVKITTPDDLAAARADAGAVPRVGSGYDLHRLVEGRPLILAGVVVPHDRGPHGHSDGDVVCHALIDAVLGAACAGDIGQHFPNTDARWQGAAGLDLLQRALAIVASRDLRVVSVDVTVILERPKLAPHVGAICGALAATLGLPASQVSVKAKTNEGVDAVGRGEAIAAHAVAVLAAGGRA
jgi:2-C-methyl-D-erythritol 4-phosphate cytidylyltransferase/2-C-methyl-D-erythritol 2,4-cyclodiphosphate synthase